MSLLNCNAVYLYLQLILHVLTKTNKIGKHKTLKQVMVNNKLIQGKILKHNLFIMVLYTQDISIFRSNIQKKCDNLMKQKKQES